MGDATQTSPLLDPHGHSGYGDAFGMRISTGDLLASRYRADALLGRGGMGEVWRCFDMEEQRDVAIKTVLAEHLSNAGVRRLFQSEVVAVARLGHPGIIEVYDLLAADDGTSLLVMEYRPGKALDEALRSLPSWSLVRSVFVQVCEALAHAHARSVLHLDIKPANVLVERDDEGVRATLVDFGIARVKQPGRGAERWFDSAVIVGTLEYMAPEQCRGELEKLGPWTDLYTLGLMAYELTSGELPHPCDDPAEAIHLRLSQPAPMLMPRLNSVPPGFEELCMRMLAIDPHDRPACAADVLAELERIDPHDARRSDLRGLSSRPPVDTQPPPPELSTDVTAAVPRMDAPTLLVRERMGWVFAELDREEEAAPSAAALSIAPPSAKSAEQVEQAFTADANEPTPGAYGLFGLRELPVLGRVEERRALWTGLGASTMEGKASAVLLIGPAGTGKSRLARDAVERAVELGLANVMHTHWSAGGSADEGLRGMLENTLESRGHLGEEFDARLSFWLERIGEHDALRRELSVLLRPEQDAAPDAGLAVRAAVEAIVRMAALRPLVLWLDDVQWSRGEAAALVSALAAVEPQPAVCVLATVREEELGDYQQVVDELEKLCREAELVRVPMRPLGHDAARALVRGLLDLEPELRELIARRSEGNPLFVTQLVRQLVVERAIVRRGRRYGLAPHVDAAKVLPEDIGSVWARRVELSGARESDLRALAIVRERVSIEVADALVARLGRGLARSIERALSAGLLEREDGRYLWAHGLLHSYLVQSVPPEQVAELHGLAADALVTLVGREDVQEERGVHLSSAGRHREACEAMLEAALWCWRRAERDARQRRVEALCAWTTAAGFADLEARALAELGHLHAERGSSEAAALTAQEARRKAEAAGDDAASAWASMRYALVMTLNGRASDGTDALIHAIEHGRRAGDVEAEAIGLLQLALARYRNSALEEASRLFDSARSVASASGNRATMALVLLQSSSLEEPSDREQVLRRAIAMARAAGALRVELLARQLWADALWGIGERDMARREASLVSLEASRRSMRQTVSIIELQAACWAVEEQDWERARSHRDMALRWGARTGAVPERAVLAAIDLVLALRDRDDGVALDSVERLECEAKGYSEPTFRDLLVSAEQLATPVMAARIAALRS